MNRIEQVHADTGESAPAGVLAVADLAWAGRALRDLYFEGFISMGEYICLGNSLYSDMAEIWPDTFDD
jgi:hypothetical protein